jgi:hypothetical protein
VYITEKFRRAENEKLEDEKDKLRWKIEQEERERG